jgi:hypothetical protein
MKESFAHCDRCGKVIAYGKPYVSVTYSVEVAERCFLTQQDEAEVIDCHAILTLCHSCGNAYNASFFELVVSDIPYTVKKVCEN